MSKLLVSDELWNLVEPILPKHPYVPGVGKPRVPDRVCLTGILFVLKTGIPWEDFPHEMGCCGMTLWNRLDEWRRSRRLGPTASTGVEPTCVPRSRSTSRASSWIRRPSVRCTEEKNGTKPRGPQEKRVETPHRC